MLEQACFEMSFELAWKVLKEYLEALKGRAIDQACGSDLSYILNEESSLPYFFDILHYESVSERELVEHINRVERLIYVRKDAEIAVYPLI